MHQPYYKDDLTGSYILPWVRMHGIKDYYDMPALLTDFPDIHQTFNLVPSLLKQINDYVGNGATDVFLTIALKPASDLELEDKLFLLKNSFMANWDTMIKPYPGYWRLLDRRGFSVSHDDLLNATRYFTDQDYLRPAGLVQSHLVRPAVQANGPAGQRPDRKGLQLHGAGKSAAPPETARGDGRSSSPNTSASPSRAGSS